jgi:hypothetical protein
MKLKIETALLFETVEGLLSKEAYDYWREVPVQTKLNYKHLYEANPEEMAAAVERRVVELAHN